MIKKILAIMVSATIILLCLSSCSKANTPFLTNGISKDKLSFFEFRNLEWGMSFENVCKALDKKESDFELSLDKKSPEEFPIIHKEYNIKLDVLGDTAQSRFIFKSAPLSEYIGLVSVDITYTDMTAEKFNATLENVKKNIEYQGIKYDEVKTDGNSFEVKSQSNYNDFSQAHKEKFNKYGVWLCEQVINNGLEPPVPKGYDYNEFDFFGQAMTGGMSLPAFLSHLKKFSRPLQICISVATHICM